jgi:transporter family protein
MNSEINWKLLVYVYMITAGLWGFFLKVVLRDLDWKTALFYVFMTIFLIYCVFLFRKIRFGFSGSHLLALVTGCIAVISTITFYKLLSIKPASVIVPLSSQYVVITVVLSILFLGETLSPKILLGIFLSIISIILLTRWSIRRNDECRSISAKNRD